MVVIVCLGTAVIFAGCTQGPEDGPRIVGPAPDRKSTPIPRPPVTPPKSTPSPKPPAPKPAAVSLAGRTIIVDPGHGGKDPGAGERTLSRVPEKTLVLEIARELASQLDARGATVIVTRKGDYFIEREDRAAVAETYRADLLVSVHADSHRNSSISGASIYIARSPSAESRRIANSVSAAIRKAGVACRGVLAADFQVLTLHSRPSILVETGYLTNPTEARNLNASWYRAKMARCIADGITAALGK